MEDHRDTRSQTPSGRDVLSDENSVANWGSDGTAGVVAKFVASILLGIVAVDVLFRGLWRWSGNLLNNAALAASWIFGRIAVAAGRSWLAGAASAWSIVIKCAAWVGKASMEFMGELAAAVGWTAATASFCYLLHCFYKRQGQAMDAYGRKKGADCLALMEKFVRNQGDFSEDLRVKFLAVISEEKAGLAD
ncbi:hypothetical protein THAOC_11358 [Thalassiosira oceanica]|uniref:Uncharacterized protein n=1 Tax=Thalassiosira oceanica TaxID=159749 RepID=K0T2R5_THAOC|nr:hypothetical protein THAOC_11358 [Thalassiosira oceanica]|eukprot:EJK67586.1 hypothetical protein THAOC_11358 [Thalassiosira oceanica]